jgi:TorA maturation chaperone TorD
VPLVQSVHVGGGLESPTAHAVRGIAEAAGLALDRDVTRAAAPDHLGVILCLWAELAEAWPKGAAQLAREHLAWARAPLATLAARGGFYGRLARTTSAAIDVIVAATR